MKALIFGSFNPVTNAHLEMGRMAAKTLGPGCQVTYIPANRSYMKNWKGYTAGNILPADIRIKLLKDAIKEQGLAFEVSTVETSGFTNGLTYNTIHYFGFGDSILCLGMDNVLQMDRWYQWQELLARTPLLVFARGSYDDGEMDRIKSLLGRTPKHWIVDGFFGCKGISSTKVRDCYIHGDIKQIKSLVPENVYEYLKKEEGVFYV